MTAFLLTVWISLYIVYLFIGKFVLSYFSMVSSPPSLYVHLVQLSAPSSRSA